MRPTNTDRQPDRSTPGAGGSLGLLTIVLGSLAAMSYPLLGVSVLGGVLSLLAGWIWRRCRQRLSETAHGATWLRADCPRDCGRNSGGTGTTCRP